MRMERPVYLTGKGSGGIRRGGRLIPARESYYALAWGETEFLIVYRPRRGRQVKGTRPRGFPGPFDWCDAMEVPTVVKRPKPLAEGEESGPACLASTESKTWSKLTAVIAHVAQTRYDDGTPRRGSLVMVDVLGSAWRVRVTDPDTARRLTCLGPTLDEALALTEAHLRADNCPWEVDQFAQGQRKKK